MCRVSFRHLPLARAVLLNLYVCRFTVKRGDFHTRTQSHALKEPPTPLGRNKFPRFVWEFVSLSCVLCLHARNRDDAERKKEITGRTPTDVHFRIARMDWTTSSGNSSFNDGSVYAWRLSSIVLQ